MGRFVPLVWGALSALQALGATAQGTPPCILGCSGQVRADFAKFACGSADDAGCLCWKPDFSYGIRDCGASCGTNDANVRQFLVQGFCKGVLPESPGGPVPSAPHPTQETSRPTPTVSAAPSTEPDIPAGEPPSTAPQGDSSGSGLSRAAVIGIGVGIGAAVVALAGVVICVLLRGRKRIPRQSIEISKPLPGSGRTYPPHDHGSSEKYGNDIEMTSNRYEDMVPRQQPRTMIGSEPSRGDATGR